MPALLAAPLDKEALAWATISMAASFLVGAGVLYALVKWQRRELGKDRGAVELTEYRAMYDRGEITAAEYAKVRQRVADQLKRKPAPAGGTADVPDLADLPADKPPPPAPDKPPA